MKIYLVTGSSGSYSDHSEWPVKAFVNESRANDYAAALPKLYADLTPIRQEDHDRAQQLYEELLVKSGGRYVSKHYPEFMARERAHTTMRELHDPNFYDSGGVSWEVSSLELDEE